MQINEHNCIQKNTQNNIPFNSQVKELTIIFDNKNRKGNSLEVISKWKLM